MATIRLLYKPENRTNARSAPDSAFKVRPSFPTLDRAEHCGDAGLPGVVQCVDGGVIGGRLWTPQQQALNGLRQAFGVEA
jgi:hypothetical protein